MDDKSTLYNVIFSVEEKRLVDEVFNNAMDVLSEQDRSLPQVENVKPLLRRGIGIHHGGKSCSNVKICIHYEYFSKMVIL